MITRRKLIAGVSAIGGVTLAAGCSGNAEETDNSQTETDNQATNESEEDDSEEPVETDEIGSEIFVQNISYSYAFSGGLSSTTQVVNNREQGSGAVEVNISMVAYDGETEIGEDNSWQAVTATAGESEYDESNDEQYQRFAEEVELNIEEISQTGDYSVEDITEVVIRGRTQQNEYTRVESMSGSELRNRIDS
jgi:hypothetical protein